MPEAMLYRTCDGSPAWCGLAAEIATREGKPRPREELLHYHTRSGKLVPGEGPGAFQ